MGCAAVSYWYTLHEACCQVCSTFKGVKTVSTEGASCKCIMSPQSIYLLKLVPFLLFIGRPVDSLDKRCTQISVFTVCHTISLIGG